MGSLKFVVEEEGAVCDGGDTIYPPFKMTLESTGDMLTEHLECFKAVMRAVGHAEDNINKITSEPFTERLARYKEDKRVEKIKDELYQKHLEKEAKKKARKKS